MTDNEVADTFADASWKRPFKFLLFGWLLLLAAVVGLIVLRQSDNAASTARNAAATITEDYTRCVQANESRAQLRLLRDYVANPNPIDPDTVTDDELRQAVVFSQQRAARFRAELGEAWEPPNCEEERAQAEARRERD